MQRPCFHLSIPAVDLDRCVAWYRELLGCRPGRRSPMAAILDLHGHQLVLQLDKEPGLQPQQGIYPRHFGLVFATLAEWDLLRERLERHQADFAVPPKCRYRGEALEHHTFFLQDPSGNWLEFKHYSNPEAVLGCSAISEVGDRDLRG